MIIIDDEDCKKLTIACCIVGGAFGVELLLVIHNVSRYLCRLRITKPLIVMFYVFVTLNIITNMCEFFLKASDPRKFWSDGHEDVALKLAIQSSLYFEILIGICLILTMWQLAVTLSQIVD